MWNRIQPFNPYAVIKKLREENESLRKNNKDLMFSIAGIAHESSSAANIAATMLKLILLNRYGDVGKSVRETLISAHLHLDYARKVSDTLLSLEKIRHTNFENKELLDLRLDVIDVVLLMFSDQMGEKDLRLDNSFGSVPANSIFIPAYFYSTILSVYKQLISNAIKHMKPGCFMALGREIDSERGICIFNAYNNGEPIDSEIRDSIFDKFVCNEQPSSNMITNTGVGLPLAKGFIEIMGGEIWLECDSEGHPNFKFSLPINKNCVLCA